MNQERSATNHEQPAMNSTMNVIQIEKVDERALMAANHHRACEAQLVNILQEIARKAVEFPELKSAIELGTLSVSKARKITPVLTQENKTEWLEIAMAAIKEA